MTACPLVTPQRRILPPQGLYVLLPIQLLHLRRGVPRSPLKKLPNRLCDWEFVDVSLDQGSNEAIRNKSGMKATSCHAAISGRNLTIARGALRLAIHCCDCAGLVTILTSKRFPLVTLLCLLLHSSRFTCRKESHGHNYHDRDMFFGDHITQAAGECDWEVMWY